MGMALMASGRVMAPVRPSFVTPRGFFTWGRGSGAKEGGTPQQLQFQYHDVELPFPMSLVSNTHLRDRELKCCYKATVDGFSATDFHRRCDFKGPCVVLGHTDGGFRFGGFNPEGYRSTDDYYDTLDAFLFYWPEGTAPVTKGEAEASPPPVVLPKVGGSGAALFDYARGGPQFGADGLLIGPPLTAVMGVFTGPDASSGVGDLRSARRGSGSPTRDGPAGRRACSATRPVPSSWRYSSSAARKLRASTDCSVRCLRVCLVREPNVMEWNGSILEEQVCSILVFGRGTKVEWVGSDSVFGWRSVMRRI